MKNILNKLMSELSIDDKKTLETILLDPTLIPTKENVFNGFKNIQVNNLKYIIFGESPYPRNESACGYAFIDNSVDTIWENGNLSKQVNKATSLRNLMKTSLVAEGLLNKNHTSKKDIESIIWDGCSVDVVNDIHKLRTNLENNGVALLNICLSFRKGKVLKDDVKFWLSFMDRFLYYLHKENPDVKLVLWGGIAKQIKKMESYYLFSSIESEHPYNVSFIKNKEMQNFLKEIKFLKE